VKKNQDSFHQYACKLLKDRPVDHVGEVEKGHGRFEIRDLTVVEVDTEVSPFPHVAQIIKETRIYRDTKDGALPSMSVRIFGTSHRPGEKSVTQLGQMIREHWSVENRNHWKRDATRWREDRSPKRCARGAKNLALLRNALLAVIPFEDFSSLNDAFETYLKKTHKAVSLILSAPPITD
jgi:hypothetical protein